MKKFLIVNSLAITLAAGINHDAFAGGDSFAGSFGGSMLGSAIGTSIASRPSNNGGSSDNGDGRALRAVDRLEDMMRRDLQALNDKISKLEKRLSKLEAAQKRQRLQAPKRVVVQEEIIEAEE